MSELDQDLLQKMVGRMTSDHAAERAIAAAKFVEALARAGLSHEDIAITKAAPRYDRGAANPLAEAQRYMRERAALLEEMELENSARNFARVMEALREENRLLKYEVAVLSSFVSLEVIRIAKSRIEIEQSRARDEKWKVKQGAMAKEDRTYPSGPGGKPGWIKAKV